MKNIKIFLLIIAANLLSCKGFLEEDMRSDISEDHLNTAGGFEYRVNAVYGRLKKIYGQQSGLHLTVFGTDIHREGSDGSHKGLNFYDGDLNARDGFIRDVWRDCYKGINDANAVLSAGEINSEISEEIKTLRYAEVRFLRALYYFWLVRHWGAVHITTEETVGPETEATRSPVEDVYDVIIKDLEFAVNNLPDEQSDYGRVTKPAAEFLLGKTLLTLAYIKTAEEVSLADQAATLFESVISNYSFSLLSDWADLWDMDNQQNSEIVFSVQNTTNTEQNGNGNRAHLYFLPKYDELKGMQRSIEYGRPFVRFRPTDYLLSLWNREHDSRYDKGYQSLWLANNEENLTDGQKVGDTAVYIPGPGYVRNRDVYDRYQNSTDCNYWSAEKERVNYLIFSYSCSDYQAKWYPHLKKFNDPRRVTIQHEQGSRDWVIMRLADAHLLAAEAHLMAGVSGVDAKVLDHVNKVRKRAAWAGSETDMEVSSVDLDLILDERARELAGEGHRWFDLARTDKLIERVRLHNPSGKNNIEYYHVLRPIPQDQIDRATNKEEFEQNEGY